MLANDLALACFLANSNAQRIAHGTFYRVSSELLATIAYT